MFSNIADLLVLWFTILVQSLPRGGAGSVILSLVLILCSFAWLWAVEKAIRIEISEDTDVDMAHLGLGPCYSAASRAMMWIGGSHLAINLLCTLLGWSGAMGPESVAVFGPQGLILDAIGLASLAPLPYMIALPFALVGYGFLFCAIFYATGIRDLSPKPSAIWWLKPFYVVPFIWFVLPFRLLRLGAKKKKKAKEEADKDKDSEEEAIDSDEAQSPEGAGSADASAAPQAASAAKDVEVDDAPEYSGPLPYAPFTSSDGLSPLKEVDDARDAGIHVQGHVTVQRWSYKDGPPGTGIEGRLFRHLPRYDAMIRQWVTPALFIAIIASVLGLVWPQKDADIDLPVGLKAYVTDVGDDKTLTILPKPFEYSDTQRESLAAMAPALDSFEPVETEKPADTDAAPAEPDGAPAEPDGAPAEPDEPSEPTEVEPAASPQPNDGDNPALAILAADVLTIKHQLTNNETYACKVSPTDYDAVIALAIERDEDELADILMLNAELCRLADTSVAWDGFWRWVDETGEQISKQGFIDTLVHVSKMAADTAQALARDAEGSLTEFSDDFQDAVDENIGRERRLRRIRKAADRLNLEDDEELGSRAQLIAAMVHAARPGQERVATTLFLKYVRTHETSLSGLNALLLHVNLLIRLNRWDAAEELLEAEWARTRSALGSGSAGLEEEGAAEERTKELSRRNEEAKRKEALALLTGLNYGALYEVLYRPLDAHDHYRELVVLGDRGFPDLLKQVQERLVRTDNVEQKGTIENTYWKERIRLLGPMYASTVAALLLFLIGLKRSLRSPSITRNREPPEEPEAKPERKAPRPTRVPWDTIAEGLEKNFTVSRPVELVSGVCDEITQELNEMSAQEKARADLTADQKQRGPLIQKLETEKKKTGADAKPERVAQLEAKLEKLDAKIATATKQLEGPKRAPEGKETSSRSSQTHSGAGDKEKPFDSFVQAILGARGRLANQRVPYTYQRQVCELVAKHRDAGARGQTIIVSMARLAGKTTAGLLAAAEAMLERGETVLFISASPERSAKLHGEFEESRKRGIWGWNVSATEGRRGVMDALLREDPVRLLFADLETLDMQVLPFDRQTALQDFIDALGVVVIEDVDAYSPARAGHASFVFRRLAQMFENRGVKPVTLVTTRPIFAHDEAYCRSFLGPLAQRIRNFPAGADTAPSREQVGYLLAPSPHLQSSRSSGEPTIEHTVAAVVQARGVKESANKGPHHDAEAQRYSEMVAAQLDAKDAGQSVQDTPESISKVSDEIQTTWPTYLVDYEGKVLQRDDRVISVYREEGLDRQLEIAADPGGALALIYPMTARSFSSLHAEIKHYGIENVLIGADEAEPEDDDESSLGVFDKAVYALLLRGPEPVDVFLAEETMCVDTNSREPKSTERLENKDFEYFLEQTRPENVLPRRNRYMNELHFQRTMQERQVPGHDESYLRETFDRDVFEDLQSRLTERGELDIEVVPTIDPRRLDFRDVQHLWAPRAAFSRDKDTTFYPDCYDNEVVELRDRETDRYLTSIEAVRADATFHERRIFMVEGERFCVEGARFQTARARGIIYCRSEPTDRRTSRVREVRLRRIEPEPPRAKRHRITTGQPFYVILQNVLYEERVTGLRLFQTSSCFVESKSQVEGSFQPNRAEERGETPGYVTEALVMLLPDELFAPEARSTEVTGQQTSVAVAPVTDEVLDYSAIVPAEAPVEAAPVDPEPTPEAPKASPIPAVSEVSLADKRKTLFAAVLLLRQVLPLVLNVRPEDIDITFGIGEGAEDGVTGDKNGYQALVRDPNEPAKDLRISVVMPWIAIVDRMEGGLGYARLLHQRLMQGEVVPDLINWAVRLSEWGERKSSPERPDTWAKAAVHTTLVHEEDEPSDITHKDMARATLLLRRLYYRAISEAPSEVEARAVFEDGEVGEGKSARTGLYDILGAETLEEELASSRLLPAWTLETREPWSLAFLCVLYAHPATQDHHLRRKVERAVMALFLLEKRWKDDPRYKPPVAIKRAASGRTDVLSEGFRPSNDVEEVELESIPDLIDGDALALEATYGALANAAGLARGTKGRAKLTERGYYLAHALMAVPGFKDTFETLVENANDGWLDLTQRHQRVESLGLTDLPPACRRIIAAGLDDVKSVKRLGKAWFNTLNFSRGKVSQQVDKSAFLRQLQTVVNDKDKLIEGRDMRILKQIKAVADFDRAFRESVNLMRCFLTLHGETTIDGLVHNVGPDELLWRGWAKLESDSDIKAQKNPPERIPDDPAVLQAALGHYLRPRSAVPADFDAEIARLSTELHADGRKAMKDKLFSGEERPGFYILSTLMRAAREVQAQCGSDLAIAPDLEKLCALLLATEKQPIERARALAVIDAVLNHTRDQLGSGGFFRLVAPRGAGPGRTRVGLRRGMEKRTGTDDAGPMGFGLDCMGHFIAETGWTPDQAELTLADGTAPDGDDVSSDRGPWEIPAQWQSPIIAAKKPKAASKQKETAPAVKPAPAAPPPPPAAPVVAEEVSPPPMPIDAPDALIDAPDDVETPLDVSDITPPLESALDDSGDEPDDPTA